MHGMKSLIMSPKCNIALIVMYKLNQILFSEAYVDDATFP